jgi:asparagine synthase (glutamine-hydrolysing)
MAGVLAHRGPDGEGFAIAHDGRFSIGPDHRRLIPERRGELEIGLAHRRLAIIDLTEASSEPMPARDGRVVLVFNGEIYNYRELRAELEGKGHRFDSVGDTEVLLRAYLEWGPACTERLLGMWAFAIADLDQRILLLSRDRFGIKPLFWTELPGRGIAFASEIKALRELPHTNFAPDPSIVKRFLLTGVVDEREETFVEGIRRVMPAENFIVPLDEGTAGIKRERYWSIPEEPGPARAHEAEEVRELLTDSVRIHLRSDVPLGTCLSGGIDSSGLVGICDELRRTGEVPTYTHHAFGYVPPSGTYSEEHFMRLAADRTGAELTVVQPDDETFQGALMDIVRHQDEPFGSLSIAAQYFVFRAAREGGMTVMLDGQGADEVFGGYHHYLIAHGAHLLQRRRALAYLHYALKHQRYYGKPPIAWGVLARETPLRHVLPPLKGTHGGRAAPDPQSLLAGPLAAADPHTPQDPLELHELLRQQTASVSLPSLLRFEDRNSMAHSIESRVPYLDHRVVELAFSLPPESKLAGVQPKAVLRRALADLLPPEVLARRDKIGFRADTTATHAFASRHADALREARTEWEREWFDQDAVDDLIASADRSDAAELSLWRITNLKLWLRLNWDGGRDPLEPTAATRSLTVT